MRYLLDTNVISDVVGKRADDLAARVKEEARQERIFTSLIVVAELRFGYTRIRSRRLQHAYDLFLGSILVEPWDLPCDRIYAELRSSLEERGRPVGAMDMLIAAHAIAANAVLVTRNVRHFAGVDGLIVESW